MKRWRERRGDVPEPAAAAGSVHSANKWRRSTGCQAKRVVRRARAPPSQLCGARAHLAHGQPPAGPGPAAKSDVREHAKYIIRPPAHCAAALLLDRGDRGRRRGGSCPRKTPAATAAAVAPEAGALVTPHVAPPIGSGPATRRRWASPPASPHHTAPMPKLRTHLLEERRRRGLESAAAGRNGQQAKPTKELAWVGKGIAAAPGQLMQAAAAHLLPLLLPPPLLSATWSTSSCVHFSQCTSTPYQRH